MDGRLLMGIDIGTSVVKCVIFDPEGRELACARAKTNVIREEAAYSEIDMESLWELTKDCIREAITGLTRRGEMISAIGISGTASGLWALDEKYRPVSRAILWNDGRAAAIIASWEKAGTLRQIFEIGGNTVFPGYPVALARWSKENSPENWNRVRHVIFNKDWIRWKLTGELATDPSDVGYLPGNIRERSYSNELFNLCGVPELRDKLPEIRDSGSVAGFVTSEIARELGLGKNVPVVAGLVDVAASTLGAGAYFPGTACSVIGTSCINSVISSEPIFEPQGVGISCATVGNTWIRSLVNTAGTVNLDWILNTLNLAENDFATLEAMAQSIPLGSGGILYLPYLNTTGVVSPVVNPYARGIFSGLSVNHGRREMARAVYEGLALSIHDCYQNMSGKCDSLTICGGGARSRFLLQMIADCTGKTIFVPEWAEFGARGVAILAGVAAGIYPNIEAAVTKVVRIEGSIDPNFDNYLKYQTVYQRYRQLRTVMQDHWNFMQ